MGGTPTPAEEMAKAVERHADLILKASGSALRHYTMDKTRAAILMAVMDCHEEAYRAGVSRGIDVCRKAALATDARMSAQVGEK